MTTYTILLEVDPDKLIEVLLDRGSKELAARYVHEFYPGCRLLSLEEGIPERPFTQRNSKHGFIRHDDEGSGT
ncbi:hypothetical protein [Dongshaea marina]|uniref:hypothetical protein n=1 Tax=Dongshaea marina TaxID=2047966 RepID=UPI000D3E21E8|nr:hypothetical protein [Dongshaea marina]